MESPMKKYYKALVNLTITVITLALIAFLLPKVLTFFMPFVIGWIIAWIAGPLVHFFEKKLKLKRKAGSAFVIVVVIGLVVLFLYLIGAKVVEEVISLVNSLPEIWAKTESEFSGIGDRLSVIYERLPVNIQEALVAIGNEASAFVGDLLGRLSEPTINAVGNFAKSLPTLIISIIMCLLSSYFFVAERNNISEWWRTTAPAFLVERLALIRRILGKSVGGYFKAQLKIEVWMYLLLVIGFGILQVDYALVIALGIAFLDLLPFFGTGTVMVPWAIIEMLSGDYKMTIGLLIIWGVGQLARQLIQPKIVGDSIGVPPIPTLFLLFFGYKVSGVIGMIASVPLGLLFYTLYKEGIFDTTKNSILILLAGINRFRELKHQDLEEVEDMTKTERKSK